LSRLLSPGSSAHSAETVPLRRRVFNALNEPKLYEPTMRADISSTDVDEPIGAP
jgi:hypothetical protein